jgi:hypothetical protein
VVLHDYFAVVHTECAPVPTCWCEPYRASDPTLANVYEAVTRGVSRSDWRYHKGLALRVRVLSGTGAPGSDEARRRIVENAAGL